MLRTPFQYILYLHTLAQALFMHVLLASSTLRIHLASGLVLAEEMIEVLEEEVTFTSHTPYVHRPRQRVHNNIIA